VRRLVTVVREASHVVRPVDLTMSRSGSTMPFPAGGALAMAGAASGTGALELRSSRAVRRAKGEAHV